MTRSVHPHPHPGNVGSSSSSVAPAKAPSHPYAAMVMQQQQQQQQQRGVAPTFPAHMGAAGTIPIARAPPAVPISVTTASHPDPVSSSSQKQNLQFAMGGTKHNLQLATGGMPQKHLHVAAAPVKINYSAPPTLAGPRGGFTLPCSAQLSAASTAEARGLSTPSPIVPVKKSASAMPLMQGYSAASIASIHAQDAKSLNALGRRTQSAPNTVVLSTSKSKYKYRKVVGGKVPVSSSTIQATEMSPQTFLDKMISARGYSTNNFCSLDGGYYCKPTELQKASYGMKVIQAVRTSDGDLLKAILDCGLSPNPCNQFGESVVHMVCRRGDLKLLEIMVNAGCSLQVTDDFGRTPLHDACWTAEPSFGCVELILNHDARLLHIVDCRGSSPLSYVKREHWKQWIEFFRTKADTYWPARDVSKEGEQTPPPLVGAAAHSGPISDPKNAIPVELATLIASGKLDPNEFLRRKKEAMEGKQLPTADKQTTEKPAPAPVAASS